MVGFQNSHRNADQIAIHIAVIDSGKIEIERAVAFFKVFGLDISIVDDDFGINDGGVNFIVGRGVACRAEFLRHCPINQIIGKSESEPFIIGGIIRNTCTNILIEIGIPSYGAKLSVFAIDRLAYLGGRIDGLGVGIFVFNIESGTVPEFPDGGAGAGQLFNFTGTHHADTAGLGIGLAVVGSWLGQRDKSVIIPVIAFNDVAGLKKTDGAGGTAVIFER